MLDTLGDGSAHLLPKLRRGDALSFRCIAQKTAFNENAGDLNVAQNVETSVFHAAIKHRHFRQHGSVDSRGQGDVLFVLRVARAPPHVRN